MNWTDSWPMREFPVPRLSTGVGRPCLVLCLVPSLSLPLSPDKTSWEHTVYTLFHLQSFPLSLLLNQGIAESPQYYVPQQWPPLTWPLTSPGLLGFSIATDAHWVVGHVWSYPAWTSNSPVFIQLERQELSQAVSWEDSFHRCLNYWEHWTPDLLLDSFLAHC